MKDFYGSFDNDLPEDTIYLLEKEQLIARIIYCAEFLGRQKFRQVDGVDAYTYTSLRRKNMGPLRHILMYIQNERSKRRFNDHMMKQDRKVKNIDFLNEDSIESFNHYHEEFLTDDELDLMYDGGNSCVDPDDDFKLIRIPNE